ncbi:unnamed protein product, partial [Allacma fusca]
LTSETASTLLITPGANASLVFTFPENTVSSEKKSEDALRKSSDGNPLVRIVQVGLWTNHLESPEDSRNNTLKENLAHKILLVEV